ncbi:N-alpha-acetyltransferase 60 [Chamberlinius hualienensis]
MTKKVPLCSSTAIQLRFLCPEDVDEVKKLCSEWFPVEYPDQWYRDITSSPRFYSLASIFNHHIIGLIVVEIKPKSKCDTEDQGILSSVFPCNTQVAYILSLGIVEDYRRNGIASLLLENLIAHLTSVEGRPCKALYLHVLASNTAAINFYKHRNFHQHSYLPYYYSVRGKPRDGFSYVLYLNGGHPPWTILYPFLYINIKTR